MIGICRECNSEIYKITKRCPKCKSPKIVIHKEINELEIVHVDCDAFYAAVEKMDNPELANKPVIVGGEHRGVVSTCCYIARIKGVRSAMPMFKAKKLCPNAVIIKPRMERYIEISKKIRKMMLELTPEIEPLSIDEAFLNMKGTQKLHKMNPAQKMAQFAKDIEQKIGISVSIGIAPNKFLAKIASDMDKPKGFYVIGNNDKKKFLTDKPITMLWGVGKATQKIMEKDGIKTIGDLQKIKIDKLTKKYGAIGTRLAELAKGEDKRKIAKTTKAKSISSETTLHKDIANPKELMPMLRTAAQKVSKQLKKSNNAGQTIILKLKTNQFKLKTRSKTLMYPTQLADVIFQNAKIMLEKETNGKTKFRLIGVGVTQICSSENADPHDLVNQEGNQRKITEKAMDKVTEKYGSRAIEFGITFTGKNKKEKRK